MASASTAALEARERIQPFFREAGKGPGVVCLHANASTSGQWRGLMDLLAASFHVLAPDLFDAGHSPAWPSDRLMRLKDEVNLIEPVLELAGAPYALVGHSYGGAVALKTALANPERVRALALYEPVLFALVDQEKPAPNDADGIRFALAGAEKALEAGKPHAAAEIFVDYWSGPGAWARTPESLKPAVAASVRNIRRWGHALLAEPSRLEEFRALDVPVLYMTGGRTTASASAVTRLLTRTLPRVEVVHFAELGHMGPVTHPAPVNQAIRDFLNVQLSR